MSVAEILYPGSPGILSACIGWGDTLAKMPALPGRRDNK
jgi:hypothetical protein